ncbi:ABC transporter ATP-binding protein [Desulfoferrobacter suflitae]|uniref:ABC transporter ATP-binding protein n=1 Tax=Desulfoferrobacter suflitae TaxID=2865782 RepID=UPI0021640393|nr:ABC transporter ATP-binding protein [Desulfoferrobacter suflitae]MCK8602573.1 ABC transporter ATP-binding protein [Desulfoferrobacter suflitae]
MENDWIRLDKVSLVRNRKTILEAIQWSVSPGDHWVVMGANGSGKTTLLQLLAGYLWPTRGNITVLGERFGHTDLRTLRKKIGWVGSFLQIQVPPSERPVDFIVSGKFASIGIFEQPAEDDYRHAYQVACRLRVDKILQSPYGVLSQGEKQRLLIARALMHNPQLVILDEPCAGLDLAAREQLLQILQDLGSSANSPTLIYVTHHLEEIVPIFTHTLLLKDGKILAQGTNEDILRSSLLQEAFGLAMEVVKDKGRYWAHIQADAVAKAFPREG